MNGTDLILRNLQRVPALRKAHKNVSMILDGLSFARAVCNSNIDVVGTVINSVKGLRENSLYIAAGFELLGAIPGSAEIEDTLNETFDSMGDELNSVMGVVRECINSVSEELETIQNCVEKTVRKALEYVEYVKEIEAVIKSTIRKYTSELFNAFFSLNKTIIKIQHTIQHALNVITVLPAVMIENTLSEIRRSVDPSGTKFKATSALLRPVVDQFLSSMTSSISNSLSGITNGFQEAFGKVNRTMSIIAEYMGEADGYLLRSGI